MARSTPSPNMNSRSNLVTVISVACVAYALASIAHELIGHGLASLLTGVKIVSFNTIFMQNEGGNHIVEAGGPAGNFIFGGAALILFIHMKGWSPLRYFLWLFSAINLMTAAGYMFYSPITDWGDWAAMI